MHTYILNGSILIILGFFALIAYYDWKREREDDKDLKRLKGE